jgi:uncharacterized protein (TIGR03083 family)
MTATDTRTLLDAERGHLLDGLGRAAWSTPSLCAGWTLRDVTVHLLMPYELTLPALLAGLARARFRFDGFAATWATGDPRSPRELVEALRTTRDRAFRVPGAPAEAALSHLVCHAEDVLRPLGVEHRTPPEARRAVLHQLVTRRGAIAPGLLDGLALTATDTGWAQGTGDPVGGSSSALVTTLVSRTAALDELTGAGVGRLRERLAASAG